MKIFYFYIFYFILCSSCSSQILVPSWFDHHTNVKKHHALEHEGTIVIAENLVTDDQLLVFDIEIMNETGHRLRFDPEYVFLEGSNSPFSSLENDPTRPGNPDFGRKYALTDNQVADFYRDQIKKEKKTAIVTGILSAGLIVFNSAMNVRDMNNEWTSGKQRNQDIRNLVTFGSLAAMDMVRGQAAYSAMNARDDLHYLSEEILSAGTILPGESQRGKVFFRASQTKFIRLIVPVENTDYVLDFRWATKKEEQILLRYR